MSNRFGTGDICSFYDHRLERFLCCKSGWEIVIKVQSSIINRRLYWIIQPSMYKRAIYVFIFNEVARLRAWVDCICIPLGLSNTKRSKIGVFVFSCSTVPQSQRICVVIPSFNSHNRQSGLAAIPILGLW